MNSKFYWVNLPIIFTSGRTIKKKTRILCTPPVHTPSLANIYSGYTSNFRWHRRYKSKTRCDYVFILRPITRDGWSHIDEWKKIHLKIPHPFDGGLKYNRNSLHFMKKKNTIICIEIRKEIRAVIIIERY